MPKNLKCLQDQLPKAKYDDEIMIKEVKKTEIE